MARRAKAKYGSAPNGANLGFEATIWAAADKLRNNCGVLQDLDEHRTERPPGTA